jgi:hypothetical protein
MKVLAINCKYLLLRGIDLDIPNVINAIIKAKIKYLINSL